VRKRWWSAITASTGATLVRESLKGRKVWSGYRVRVRLSLAREPDRTVFLELTPDAAENWALDVLEAVDRARELNTKTKAGPDPLLERGKRS
jgi:hypothetical protein